jgi:hypothetical protein
VTVRRYAEGTSVPVSRSQEELRSLVLRVEARRVAIIEDPDSAAFAFEASGRTIRFRIALPQDAPPTGGGRRRSGTAAQEAIRAEHRRRWRALVLVVKAKLEAVASGVETFEEAFLAQIVLPGTGRTIAEQLIPQLAAAYESGEPVALLPAAGGTGA